MADSAEMVAVPQRVRVWDAPTRTFHWLLASSFLGEWLTRDARYTEWHVFLGYLIAALIVFRVAWGFVGTRWARFKSFTYSARVIVRYLGFVLRGRAAHYVGHNPAGSVAIYALLLLAAGAVVTGMLVLGGANQHGPFAASIDYRGADLAREAHELIAWSMLVLVLLHIAGVAAGSLIDRENLVRAMITGRKRHVSEAAVAARIGVSALMAIATAGSAAWYFRGHFSSTQDRPYLPFAIPALAADASWTTECKDCHLAYHPSLLPARSWSALFDGQTDHFGEDLGLDQDVVAHLRAFAVAHSAEHHESNAAWHIDRSVPANEAPTRITDTRYWKHEHEDLRDELKRVSGFDCGGCHVDAVDGTFQPGAIIIGTATTKATRK